jgi:hypothetical protein
MEVDDRRKVGAGGVVDANEAKSGFAQEGLDE